MSSTNNTVILDNDWTHIGVLIDRSGSMQTLKPEIISKELTQFIKDQKGGKVTVTAARFDDIYEVFIQNKTASEVEFTAKDIEPRNTTALYESLCRIIDDVGNELSNMTTTRPGKVIIVVLTDGEENSSKGIYAGEGGRKILFDKITHQKEVYNWLFFFMGTNIDALKTGKNIGISPSTCINFDNNAAFCGQALRTASTQVNVVRGLSQDVMQDRFKLNMYSAFTQEQRGNCSVNYQPMNEADDN
jgi:hypothetical protein